MCRFLIYHGPPLPIAQLVTEPKHSLINQSFRSAEREEPLNGDGFGIAWYVPAVSPEPALFRSITPAWSNQNLLQLARVTVSPCILGHVRAATPGLAVTETNTHPFVFGRHAFMHNGEIASFKAIERELLDRLSLEPFRAIQGTTDSEHFFGLFLEHALRAPERTGAEALARALEAAIRDLKELLAAARVEASTTLNLALSDGESFVACRYATPRPENAPSLHVHAGRSYVCERGVCRMVEHEHDDGAVIVSSEALSDDPDWQVIAPGDVVLVSAEREVVIRPLAV